MSTRRDFIKTAGIHSAGMAMLPMLPAEWKAEERMRIPDLGDDIPEDEFWSRIQESYTSSRSWINLNNGGVSPQPKFVQEAFELYNRMSNEAPSYQMWRILEPTRVNIRKDLADMLNVSADEVVINRNTTEALDTIIFGLDLQDGDEIVLGKYDYPNMRNAWEQRRKRNAISLKYADYLLPHDTEEKIVNAYADLVNERTKLVHITHMVNYNGQILPVEDIITACKLKNRFVKIMLDGAHTFAHIDFDLGKMDVDFFGTSLHKWLSAPFGSGLMYIRKENIPQVWPFFPTDAVEDNDIQKFEAMGTRSIPTEVAVGQAILFHQNIGIDRKHKRLKELTDLWTEPFLGHERFHAYNPLRNGKYGSLFTFGIEGKSGNEISNFLQKEYKIITSPIQWENISGCRVSPHVYTTLSELEKLMEGVDELIRS